MLDSNYVIGLTDGEGSFTFHLNTHPRRRNRMEPRFYIKLQECDKIVLDEVQKFFGCGKVYFQKDKRPNHSHCYRFEVGNRYDLLTVIIPFFKKFRLMTPSKRKDFELFCEAMELYKERKHLSQEGRETLRRIKSKMHVGSLDAGNPLVQWERGKQEIYHIPPVKS